MASETVRGIIKELKMKIYIMSFRLMEMVVESSILQAGSNIPREIGLKSGNCKGLSILFTRFVILTKPLNEPWCMEASPLLIFFSFVPICILKQPTYDLK